MSTVSPRASREIAQRVRAHGSGHARRAGSGSVPQVQAGTLTIMVGGDQDAYARVEPLLRELGTPTHIGENGQGLVLKLAINISLAVQMLAFAEGLLLAERAGVDRKLAVEVMTESPIGSPMLKARAALVLDLPDEAWFDVGLMQKDIALALDTARQLRVPLPSAAAADELLTVARALGLRAARPGSALRSACAPGGGAPPSVTDNPGPAARESSRPRQRKRNLLAFRGGRQRQPVTTVATPPPNGRPVRTACTDPADIGAPPARASRTTPETAPHVQKLAVYTDAGNRKHAANAAVGGLLLGSDWAPMGTNGAERQSDN